MKVFTNLIQFLHLHNKKLLKNTYKEPVRRVFSFQMK